MSFSLKEFEPLAKPDHGFPADLCDYEFSKPLLTSHGLWAAVIGNL